jgi:transketolase
LTRRTASRNSRVIEGSTDLAFSEDVGARFLAYGWNVIRVADANDFTALEAAFAGFCQTDDRPTLIIVRSHIGYGAPTKQGSYEAHGSPLGAEEIRLTKRFYGWPEDAQFLVPDEVPAHFREGFGARGKSVRADWDALFAQYAALYPDLAAELKTIEMRGLPDGWDELLPSFATDDKGVAGRVASGKVLNVIAQRMPWLIGGAADLAPSTNTRLMFDRAGDFSAATPEGRNLHFGVREHAMGAILNGMALSKLRAYGSGFLIFSDYARPAIRLSALMEIPTIHIFTHDSIGVGEDGPTHQPIEQLASLRAIPGLIVLRPADANEVVEAWRVIMGLRHAPVVLMVVSQTSG